MAGVVYKVAKFLALRTPKTEVEEMLWLGATMSFAAVFGFIFLLEPDPNLLGPMVIAIERVIMFWLVIFFAYYECGPRNADLERRWALVREKGVVVNFRIGPKTDVSKSLDREIVLEERKPRVLRPVAWSSLVGRWIAYGLLVSGILIATIPAKYYAQDLDIAPCATECEIMCHELPEKEGQWMESTWVNTTGLCLFKDLNRGGGITPTECRCDGTEGFLVWSEYKVINDDPVLLERPFRIHRPSYEDVVKLFNG